MEYCKLILFVHLILIINNISNALKVSVYYESLCPDSADFITNQLFPKFSHFKDFIQLEFVPYGKASQYFINQRWYFRCQHGSEECKYNTYQSCMLDQKYNQDINLYFLNCVMTNMYPSRLLLVRMKTCAEKYNLNWNNITQCATSSKGEKLLAENGEKTRKIMPELDFVPTVVLNEVFVHDIQDIALLDFARVVCRNINGTKPVICGN